MKNPEQGDDEAAPQPAKCCNKKCKGSSFKTQAVGRILRNIMATFEFRHDCKSEPYTYNDLIKHMNEDCQHNKQLQCPFEGCSNRDKMNQKELEDHLKNSCVKIRVECKLCEESYPKDQMENPEVHTCAKHLNIKLEAEKEAVAKAEKELEESKKELEQEQGKAEELQKIIEEHQVKINEFNKRLADAKMNLKKVEAQFAAKKLNEMNLGCDGID